MGLSSIISNNLFKIAIQPFTVFWFYYLIGPIVTLDGVYEISSNQGLFKEEDMLLNIGIHIIGYLSLFPLILYCARLDISYLKPKARIKPRFFIIIPGLFLFLIFSYLVVTAIDFSPYTFFADKIRAEVYRDWVHESRIMPLLIISLTLGQLFFGPITFLILGIPAIAIDIIMGRRHILLIFIYPLVSRLGAKGLVLSVIVIGVFTSMRHGFDHMATNINELKNAIFSESYMIFLSSSTHSECSINIGLNNSVFHFERFTEYCRIMDYSAGGFIARFQYDVMFGLASVFVYSFFFWLILKVFYKFVAPVFREILGIIIFTSFFISYRDDMGNSLLFLFQYILLLCAASFLLKLMKTKKVGLT
jgi:hypothetical protein